MPGLDSPEDLCASDQTFLPLNLPRKLLRKLPLHLPCNLLLHLSANPRRRARHCRAAENGGLLYAFGRDPSPEEFHCGQDQLGNTFLLQALISFITPKVLSFMCTPLDLLHVYLPWLV